MRRKRLILLILFIFLSIIYMSNAFAKLYFFDNKYAYEISLIYYNKEQGETERTLGKPILIHSPEILNGQTSESGSYPKNWSQLQTARGLHQRYINNPNEPKEQDLNFLPDSNDLAEIFSDINNIPSASKDEFTNSHKLSDALTFIPKGSFLDFPYTTIDPNRRTIKPAEKYTCAMHDINYKANGAIIPNKTTDIIKADVITNYYNKYSGYVKYRIELQSTYTKTTYPAGAVTVAQRTSNNNALVLPLLNGQSLKTYYQDIIPMNIPEDSVSFLDKLISEQYKPKRETVSKFGAIYNESDIRYYYIKVQAVEVMDGEITSKTSSELTNFFRDPPQKEQVYLESTHYEGKATCTKEGTSAVKGTCYEGTWLFKGRWFCLEDSDLTRILNSKTSKSACEKRCYKSSGTPDDLKEVTVNPGASNVCDKGYEYTAPTEYTYSASGSEITCGIQNEAIIYGYFVTRNRLIAPSKLIDLASSGGFKLRDFGVTKSTSDANRTINSCGDRYSKHDIRDNNNKPTGQYQNYVGPNLKEALVGTTINNKYHLFGSCLDSNVTNPNRNSGTRYYHFPNPPDVIEEPCTNLCSNAGSKNSDNYLRCAENYCDTRHDANLKGNFVQEKRSCIINECKYIPTVDKCDFSREENKNHFDKTINISSSSCGNTSGNLGDNYFQTGGSRTNILNNTDISTQTAVKRSCNGEAESPVFDQKKYVNYDCRVETRSNMEGSLANNRTEIKGGVFDQSLVVSTEKICYIYFDINNWKLDFASIPSNDPARRNRLLFLLNAYNNSHIRNYSVPTSSGFYHAEYAASGYGKLDLNNTKLNGTYTGTTNQTQVVNNKLETSRFNKTQTDIDETYIEPALTVKSDTTFTISRYSINRIEVNRFVTNDKRLYSYKNAKTCVDSNGKIYYSEKCTSSNTDGKNKFYISSNATANDDFLRKNDFFHGTNFKFSNSEPGESKQYQLNDKCDYNIDRIPDPTDGVECFININSTSLSSIRCDSNKLKSGTYEIELNPQLTGSFRNNKVVGYNINLKKNGAMFINQNSPNYSFNTQSLGSGMYSVEGTVVLNNGKSAKCNNNFVILSNSCSITREENNVYRTIYSNPASVSSCAMTSYYPTKFQTNWINLPVNDCKINISGTENKIILSRIISSGRPEYCSTCFSPPETKNCMTGKNIDFKAGEYGKVEAYCANNYSSDENNFKDKGTCIRSCAVCPAFPYNDTVDPVFDDIVKARAFCSPDALQKYGFADVETCVNRCYFNKPTEPIFRQVNNYDPFPYSFVSPYKHDYLTRPIGSNWIGKDKYISDDRKDKSTITGPNAANSKPEYEITLTPEDIRKIREMNRDSGFKYTDAEYPRRDGETKQDPFNSYFIHESEFSEKFDSKNEPLVKKG